MCSYSKSIYILNEGSGDAERNRLDSQHIFFDNVMENDLLPPHIAAELSTKPSPSVLELATGSAVWLRELAKVLPASAELVGLDFNTVKFPKALPENIKLGFADMYQPFPEQLHDRFDVVHIRLFVCAAKKGMGVWLARNALSLLRPGGWLVWAETGDLHFAAQPPSRALFKYQELTYAFVMAVGRDIEIPLSMLSYLRDAGYTDCDEKTHPYNSCLYRPHRDGFLSSEQQMVTAFMRQGLQGILALGGVDSMRTQEEAGVLIAEAERELSGDTRVHGLVVRAWGRKPL
ncbi:hypothetical protein DL766_005919 [Monosporascus sp. MC13-8B]|uniref:Methyltransferase domain-containing protein n=1 Tax=Monosporascus cannonballus TaxID=155416 RepID=A0ABY0H5P2_9PEZI|nr:hypothetical protein DL762_005534 [Monosporascus cannonballus]RYO97874.1 hypothetical protein DL763_002542 [Monosporascus cannonballus]RYP28371.1 hypothetical protein DL766_005919 [Monosporascus sp. MC13-8B]